MEGSVFVRASSIPVQNLLWANQKWFRREIVYRINKFAGEDLICSQTAHPNKVLLSPSPLSNQRHSTIAMLPWRNLCFDSTASGVISYKKFKSKFILTDLLIRDVRHNGHTDLILRMPHYHLKYFGQVPWLQRSWGSVLSAVVLNKLQKEKAASINTVLL
jgi:hypothetical protein